MYGLIRGVKCPCRAVFVYFCICNISGGALFSSILRISIIAAFPVVQYLRPPQISRLPPDMFALLTRMRQPSVNEPCVCTQTLFLFHATGTL